MTELRPQGESHELRRASAPSLSSFFPRTFWRSWDLTVKDEPLLFALIKYRQKLNRREIYFGHFDDLVNVNLISSLTDDGKQMPILDIDLPHNYHTNSNGAWGYLHFPPTDSVQANRVQRAFYLAGFSTMRRCLTTTLITAPHRYVESTHDGHAHLFIDQEISTWKWRLFMWRLYRAGVLELGYFVWSMRRGSNFVRPPGTEKKAGPESGRYTYGWLFKLREKKK